MFHSRRTGEGRLRRAVENEDPAQARKLLQVAIAAAECDAKLDDGEPGGVSQHQRLFGASKSQNRCSLMIAEKSLSSPSEHTPHRVCIPTMFCRHWESSHIPF